MIVEIFGYQMTSMLVGGAILFSLFSFMVILATIDIKRIRDARRARILSYYETQLMKNYQYRSILSRMAETRSIP